VELLQPGRVMGGQGVCSTTNYATAYANVCFDCDASLETVWPCPATSGVSGCSVDSLRPTVSCVGLVNATDLYGRPIVSLSEEGEVQRARCLAAIGGTAVSGTAPCITCLARSACVDEVDFYGEEEEVEEEEEEEKTCGWQRPRLCLARRVLRAGSCSYRHRHHRPACRSRFPSLSVCGWVCVRACVRVCGCAGGGTYLDSAGIKNLCFTTPLRITLQVVVNFTLIVFIGCYTIMAFCLLLNTGLLCSFRL